METNEALLRVKHEIHTSNIYSKMDKSPNADTNFNYNRIDQIIETTKNKHIQTKVVKFNKYRHKKSYIYIMNNRGPSIEPCGTPVFIGKTFDYVIIFYKLLTVC